MAKGDSGDPWIVKQDGTEDFTTLDGCLGDSQIGLDDYIEIQGSWTVADVAASTAVGDHNLNVKAVGASAHPGYYDTSLNHYRIVDSVDGGTAALQINTTGAIFEGIAIVCDSGDGSDEGVRMAAGSGSTLTFKKTIIHATNQDFDPGDTDQDGIHAGTISCTINIENCTIQGFGRGGICAQPFSGTHTQTWNILQSTLFDNGHDDDDGDCGGIGVRCGANSTVNVNGFYVISMNNNSAATGTGGSSEAGDFNTEGAGTVNWQLDHCISTDSSITARDSGAVGALEDHTHTDGTPTSDADWVVFEDTTTRPYDLRLKSNDYNEAQDKSTATTGAGLTAVTEDIVGTTRPQNTNYDAGAFEIVAAGGATNPKGPLGLPVRGSLGGPVWI